MSGTVLGAGSFGHMRPNYESTLCTRHHTSDVLHDAPASSVLAHKEDTESAKSSFIQTHQGSTRQS